MIGSMNSSNGKLIGALGGILGELYIHAQLSVKVDLSFCQYQTKPLKTIKEGNVKRKESYLFALLGCREWNCVCPSLWSSRVSSICHCEAKFDTGL